MVITLLWMNGKEKQKKYYHGTQESALYEIEFISVYFFLSQIENKCI